ncbi:MAG: vitamin K epoxide reductase family protein [Actinomycetota bacterium]
MVLALIGVAIATHLALYQLNVVDSVREPFFGDESRTILNSSVSYLLPIPDAALGAISYLVDAVTGAIGGRERWTIVSPGDGSRCSIHKSGNKRRASMRSG